MPYWWMQRSRGMFGAYLNKDDEGAGGGGGDDKGDDKGADDDKGEGGDDKGAAGDKGEGGEGKGGNKPTDAEAKLLKDLMKHKTAAKNTAAELAALKAKFEGIDPDQVRALLKAQQDAETADLEKKGEYERVKKAMADAHATEKKTLEDQLAAVRGEVSTRDSVINRLTVGAEFGRSQFIKDEMVIPHSMVQTVFGGHFDFEEGQTVGYDKPKGAKDRTKLVDAAGEPLPFDAALKKIVDAHPEKDGVLKSKAKAGAGSGTQGGKGGDKPPVVAKGHAKIAAALAAQSAAKK